MRLREIISKKDDTLDEALMLGGIGSLIWGAIYGYNLGKPIYDSYQVMTAAIEAYNQKDPNYTSEKVHEIIQNELAKVSLTIGSMLVGNVAIAKTLGKAFSWAGLSGPFATAVKQFSKEVSQLEFMRWLKTDEVQKVLSDWLTGKIFTEVFPIIGKSGPIFNKYVGSAMEQALETIKPGAEELRNKVFGEPEKEKPTEPQTQQSTTPSTEIPQGASTTPVQKIKPGSAPLGANTEVVPDPRKPGSYTIQWSK